jgi:uncharacterized protein YneF (UPF0154 family)
MSALVAFVVGVLVGVVLALVTALAFGYWITRDYPR